MLIIYQQFGFLDEKGISAMAARLSIVVVVKC
jgi:hypothetical protein